MLNRTLNLKRTNFGRILTNCLPKTNGFQEFETQNEFLEITKEKSQSEGGNAEIHVENRTNWRWRSIAQRRKFQMTTTDNRRCPSP